MPHFLGEHDHPWLRVLLEEHERFVGQPQRELDARLREPLPCESPPTKRKQAVHVLSWLRPSRRKTSGAARARTRDGLRGSGPDIGRGRRRPFVGCRVPRSERREISRIPCSPTFPVSGSSPRRRGHSHPPSWHSGPISPSCKALLFRATSVTIEADGNARALVRHSKLRGLICTVAGLPKPPDSVLELSGPFALFRHTRLYGHALGELVPLLAWCRRFRLRAECVVEGRRLTLALGTGDPIFPADEPRRYDSRLEERFARDFRRVAPDWDVLREPEPVPAGDALIFPDFALHHRRDAGRRWLLEIVGFWTADYLARKLLQYRSAHLSNLILCIDEDRNCTAGELPAGALVVRFRRRVDAAAVLRLVG